VDFITVGFGHGDNCRPTAYNLHNTKKTEDPPDYLVILAWNFAQDIIAGTADFSAAGGKYIISIPGFKIVDVKGEN